MEHGSSHFIVEMYTGIYIYMMKLKATLLAHCLLASSKLKATLLAQCHVAGSAPRSWLNAT